MNEAQNIGASRYLVYDLSNAHCLRYVEIELRGTTAQQLSFISIGLTELNPTTNFNGCKPLASSILDSKVLPTSHLTKDPSMFDGFFSE